MQGVSEVTYTRWGKSSCPNATGAELVYAGKAGGTYYSTQGGGAEKLCLPEDPNYLDDTTGYSVDSLIHGAEYQFPSGPNRNLYQYNVPCAVCYVSTRGATIMVPAKTECPSSWTREYYGYLTTQAGTNQRSSFNCIDVDPEGIAGTSGNINGALFFYTATRCNGLDCPPYEDDRILSCAVCTK